MDASRFDVLLTDIGLPDISGTELAAEIRQRLPEIGLVFATGASDIETDEGLEDVHILKKPFDELDLQASLAGLAPLTAAGEAGGLD